MARRLQVLQCKASSHLTLTSPHPTCPPAGTQVAEKIAAEGKSVGWLTWLSAGVWRAFAAVERWTGFNRNQLALGLQVGLIVLLQG